MVQQAFVAAVLASALAPLLAAATFDGNLNYASPSRRSEHAFMGIDVPHVARRSLKRGAVAHAADELAFTHGVASGDPLSDRVVLWTRVAPRASPGADASNVTVEGTVPLYNHDTQVYIKADANPICVDWAVFGTGAGKSSSSRPVSKGRAYTTSDIDYTVKVSPVVLYHESPGVDVG